MGGDSRGTVSLPMPVGGLGGPRLFGPTQGLVLERAADAVAPARPHGLISRAAPLAIQPDKPPRPVLVDVGRHTGGANEVGVGRHRKGAGEPHEDATAGGATDEAGLVGGTGLAAHL